MKISVAVITLNEESNIEDCLGTVPWADEKVVVDSGSTDRTVARAEASGARVFYVPFENYSQQKNAAIERCTGDWIFLMDADERASSDLGREIRRIVERKRDPKVYKVRRDTYFFGKLLNFSGTQEDAPIRLIPRGRAHFEQPVHEQIATVLPIKRLKHRLLHYSTVNMTHYKLKLKRYLPFEIDILSERDPAPKLYDIIIRPTGIFFTTYFLKKGFLDGVAGLQFAGLATAYSFLKYYRYFFKRKKQKDAKK